ncbi:MAG: PRTRC system protein C [Pseudomonas sp.]|nr:PRTRC system protein C [Pseudomonas sp.]
MALIEICLARVFRYSGRDLPDPQSEMTPGEVLKHYARQFPKLNGAKIIDPIVEKDTYVYEFRDGGFGAKG